MKLRTTIAAFILAVLSVPIQVVEASTIFAILNDGSIKGYDPATGNYNNTSITRTVSSSGALTYSDGVLFALNNAASIYAFDITTGATVGTYGVNYSSSGDIAVGDGILYGLTTDGRVIGVDLTTGSQVKTFGVGDLSPSGGIAYFDGGLYAVTTGGSMLRFDVGNGSQSSSGGAYSVDGGLTAGNGRVFGMNTSGTVTYFGDYSPTGDLAYGDGFLWGVTTTGYVGRGGSQLCCFGGGNISTTGGIAFIPTAVPLPSAAWLLTSGLLGLIGVAKRRA